jgi:hypothetical protein
VLLSISGPITGQHVDLLRGLLEQERRAVAETREVVIGLSDAQEKTLDAWVHLSGHFGEHSLNSTAA